MQWRVDDLDELADRRARANEEYLEFLKVPALNAGVYELKAGAADTQTPHDEDEVYYAISGRARLEVDGRTQEIGPGAVIYVARDVPHRFVDIQEDLRLLVFFSSWRA